MNIRRNARVYTNLDTCVASSAEDSDEGKEGTCVTLNKRDDRHLDEDLLHEAKT